MGIMTIFKYLIKFHLSTARRVLLRPLTAKQLYGALRSAGREDAVPEGRVVSQGISAATGFTLGLIKGVGGTMLATSNATTEWLNNLNLTAHIPNVDLYSLLPNVNLSLPNIDYSALLPTLNLSGIDYSALLPNLNITTLFTHKASGSNSSTSTSYVVQEICFQTRSAQSNAKVQGRQVATSPTTTATTTGVGTASPTTTGTGTESPTGTGMATFSNTASATAGTSPTGFSPTASGTSTTGTTTTEPNQTTCIVIEKPATRRRRRRSFNGKLKRSTVTFN